MKKIMLVGETGSGKSSLIRALAGEGYASRRAMAVEYYGPFINTPGEFLENSRFYYALITTAVECGVMVFVHDATRSTSMFPPQFASIFNRKAIAVVSKIDMPGARPELGKRFLQSAGAKDCVMWSAKTHEGQEQLHALLGLG